MWKRIWILFVARNKEFYRDRSALGWNLLFPFLIIIGYSFLFGGNAQSLYKVGVVRDTGNDRAALPAQFVEFRKTRHVEFIEFDTVEQGLARLTHHRIDLLVQPSAKRYWMSSTSPKGYVSERLLASANTSAPGGFERQSVEGKEVNYVEWLFPGILGMNIMFSALFGVGYTVVRYRKNGALKRMSVTPVRPHEFLTAQVLSRMFLILVTTAVVYAGCALLYGFSCRGSYATLFLVFAVGGFSMVALGLLVASRSSSEEFAGGVLNLLSWPMIFLSEVWFSLEGARPWVRKLAGVFPLTPMIDAARKVMNDGAGIVDVGPQLVVMAAMSALFLLAGSLLFSWRGR